MARFLVSLLPLLVILSFPRTSALKSEDDPIFQDLEELNELGMDIENFRHLLPDSSTPQLLKECGQAQGEVLASFEASKAEAERAVKGFFYFCLSVSHLSEKIRQFMISEDVASSEEDLEYSFFIVLNEIRFFHEVTMQYVIDQWMKCLSTAKRFLVNMERDDALKVRNDISEDIYMHHLKMAKDILVRRAFRSFANEPTTSFWNNVFYDISTVAKGGVDPIELYNEVIEFMEAPQSKWKKIFVASLEEAEKASAMIAVYDMIKKGDIVPFWLYGSGREEFSPGVIQIVQDDHDLKIAATNMANLMQRKGKDYVSSMYKKCTEIGQRVFNEIEAKMTEDR